MSAATTDPARWLDGHDLVECAPQRARLTEEQCGKRKRWDHRGCFGCPRAPEIKAKPFQSACRRCHERPHVGAGGLCGLCLMHTGKATTTKKTRKERMDERPHNHP